MPEGDARSDERDGSTRGRLLDAVVAHALAEGIADLSLRDLASAAGTSHRMLIYHFGSKDQLLVEVARAVEARQQAAFADLGAEPGADAAGAVRAMWARFADPALWPQERLFFELYVRALRDRPGTEGFLEDDVEAWVDAAEAQAAALGLDPTTARVDARFGVALLRGLLLDLLATGDREACDAVVERWAVLLEAAEDGTAGG